MAYYLLELVLLIVYLVDWVEFDKPNMNNVCRVSLHSTPTYKITTNVNIIDQTENYVILIIIVKLDIPSTFKV